MQIKYTVVSEKEEIAYSNTKLLVMGSLILFRKLVLSNNLFQGISKKK